LITRISLIPFDLGGSDSQVLQDVLINQGYIESPLEGLEKRLVGLEASRWYLKDQQGGATLYLERRGFGVLVDREATDATFDNHKDIAGILKQRWQLHEQVHQGQHPLAKKIEALRDQAKGEFGKALRWSAWEGVPYVFSLYVAEDEVLEQLMGDPNALLGMVALSEPSRVRFGDTETKSNGGVATQEDAEERIGSLDSSDLPNDVETSQEMYCGATWASLIVVGRSGDVGTTIKTYELLEVRTQIAWLAAHQVRRWSERNLARGEFVSSSQLDEVRWEVLPLLREAKQLSDASMSTRHSMILTALKNTSGLEQEIEAAEDALQWSYEAAERIEARQRHRYELVVEVLLGMLAVLQLATLIYEVPLVSLSTWAASLILVVSALGIALVVARNRQR
jgi:hypothetical protein